MADILTLDVMRKRMRQYPKIVSQFGADSEQAKRQLDKYIELIKAYAQGQIDIEKTPESMQAFIEYVKMFGRKDKAGELIPEASEALARLEAGLNE